MFERYITKAKRTDRFGTEIIVTETNVRNVVKDSIIGLVLLILLITCWPFGVVPTGHRGVVTQFGRIVGIEGEGLAILPPWQKLEWPSSHYHHGRATGALRRHDPHDRDARRQVT